MKNSDKLRRSIAKRHGTMWEVFTMGAIVFQLIAQLMLFFTIWTMSIYVIAAYMPDVNDRRVYAGLTLLATLFVSALFGYIWMRSMLMTFEGARQERERNGRFCKSKMNGGDSQHIVVERPPVVTTNTGKKKYLINGRMMSKSDIDRMGDSGVGG